MNLCQMNIQIGRIFRKRWILQQNYLQQSMSSQLFTKARQGASNQKFIRKNSQSPWQKRKSNLHTEPDQPSEFSYANSNTKPVNNKNSPMCFNQKQHRITIRTITSEYYSNANGISKVRKNEYSGAQGMKVQQSKIQNESTQESENIKIGTLPIETMSTCESQPTKRKKISQSLQTGLQTKRNQNNLSFRKDIQLMIQENRNLMHLQHQKQAQIVKLLNQIEQLKLHNKKIETELSKCTQFLHQSENRCKANKFRCQELQKMLSQSQTKRVTNQRQLKQLKQKIMRIQQELRTSTEDNRKLTKIIQVKQLQKSKAVQCQYRSITDRSSRQSQQISYNSPNNKIIRSLSINETGPATEPRVYTVRADTSQLYSSNKCNRFVQTQSSRLQVVLKENELMLTGLKNKDKTVRGLQKDIKVLENKNKIWVQTSNKLAQAQKLIQHLNGKVITDAAVRLANKYKYY